MSTLQRGAKPLVTYVLYAHNEAAFIAEAIRSALAQDYEPMDIVLSDDGSEDETFGIMEQFASEYRGPHRVLLNRNSRNIGIGSQLNAAVAISRGEILVLANGDDVSRPWRVRTSVDAMQGGGEVVTAVCSDLETMDEDGRPLPRVISGKPRFSTLEQGVRLRFGGPPAASLALSRVVFTRFGQLDPALILEDGPLSMRAFLLGRISHVSEPMVCYRVHAHNISQAYEVAEYEVWLARHRVRRLWACREGVRAYLQILNDLHAVVAAEWDHAEVERARFLGMEMLLACELERLGLLEGGDVGWRTQLHALLCLARKCASGAIKSAIPWLARRAERWHYRQVIAASRRR